MVLATGSEKVACVSSTCWRFVCKGRPATQQPNMFELVYQALATRTNISRLERRPAYSSVEEIAGTCRPLLRFLFGRSPLMQQLLVLGMNLDHECMTSYFGTWKGS